MKSTKLIFLVVCLLLLVLTMSCTMRTVRTDDQGNTVTDTKLDVEKTCFIVRSAVNIGLPLAIENYKGTDKLEHIRAAVGATEAILTFLQTNKTAMTETAFNEALETYATKLSPAERHAVQSGLSLVLHLVQENVDARGHINQDVVTILLALFGECKKVFDLYATSQATEMPARLQYKRPAASK